MIEELEKDEKIADHLNNQIQIHRRIYNEEISSKGKYAKGYADTMEKLAGPLGSGAIIPKKERKSLVNWIFQKQSSFGKNPHPYNQGEIKAIMDFKKENRKRGLNIYNEKIINRTKKR